MEIRTLDSFYCYGPLHRSQCIVPKSYETERLKTYFTNVTETPIKTGHYTCTVGSKGTSTSVDVVTDAEEAILAFTKFANNCKNPPGSVVVWDLDDTIIREDDTIKCSKEILKQWRSQFDYMVLWSNGSADHVSTQLDRLEITDLFDMTIALSKFENGGTNKPYGVVLKELNKKFNIPYTTISVLIDDLEENYDDDYDVFVCCASKKYDFLKPLTNIMDGKMSK